MSVNTGSQQGATPPPPPVRHNRPAKWIAAAGGVALAILGFTANVLGVADWVNVNVLDQRVITSNEDPLGVDARKVIVSGDQLPGGEAVWIVAENVEGVLFPFTEAQYRAAEEEYAATLRSEQFGPSPETLTVHAVIADEAASEDFQRYFQEAAVDPALYEEGLGSEWAHGARIIDSFP
jgi:hypothetical protein